MEIIQRFLRKDAAGNPGLDIEPKTVVVHWTSNENAGADALANSKYFDTTTRKASAHYVVDDHCIVQNLPETKMAFHVGASAYTASAVKWLSDYPNNSTIGVEICVNADGDFSKTWNNAVWLVADICKRWGWDISCVWRHFDVTRKVCPAFFVDDTIAMKYCGTTAQKAWEKFQWEVVVELRRRAEEKRVDTKEQTIQWAVEQGWLKQEHDPNTQVTWYELIEFLKHVLSKG